MNTAMLKQEVIALYIVCTAFANIMHGVEHWEKD